MHRGESQDGKYIHCAMFKKEEDIHHFIGQWEIIKLDKEEVIRLLNATDASKYNGSDYNKMIQLGIKISISFVDCVQCLVTLIVFCFYVIRL